MKNLKKTYAAVLDIQAPRKTVASGSSFGNDAQP